MRGETGGIDNPACRRHAPQGGFTFLEIMAVVVIIGVLMGIVGAHVTKHIGPTRVTATRAQIDTLVAAIRTFELDTGRLPDETEGLSALLECPSSIPNEQWRGPYLDTDVLPVDPWHSGYRYQAPGENRIEFDVWSPGPDRQDGTEDDIGNWTPKKPS